MKLNLCITYTVLQVAKYVLSCCKSSPAELVPPSLKRQRSAYQIGSILPNKAPLEQGRNGETGAITIKGVIIVSLNKIDYKAEMREENNGDSGH